MSEVARLRALMRQLDDGEVWPEEFWKEALPWVRAALSEEAAVPLDVTESDPIETFAHPFLAPIVVAGHQFFHTSDCDWGAADTPSSDTPERPAHHCDLPENHDGECWHESGTEDD